MGLRGRVLRCCLWYGVWNRQTGGEESDGDGEFRGLWFIARSVLWDLGLWHRNISRHTGDSGLLLDLVFWERSALGVNADRDALEAWHIASIGAAATEAAQQVYCGEEDVDFERR